MAASVALSAPGAVGRGSGRHRRCALGPEVAPQSPLAARAEGNVVVAARGPEGTSSTKVLKRTSPTRRGGLAASEAMNQDTAPPPREVESNRSATWGWTQDQKTIAVRSISVTSGETRRRIVEHIVPWHRCRVSDFDHRV